MRKNILRQITMQREIDNNMEKEIQRESDIPLLASEM
jgi:hypothetical protein